MTEIRPLVEQLIDITKYQQLPESMQYDDYFNIIVRGIKELYIDTGRQQQFKNEMIHENDEGEIVFDDDLPIDEERYVLVVSQIDFFKRVQADVNNIVSYTTNALSVTGADRPYAHLQDTIANLENERRIIHYHMIRYCFE